MGYNQGLAVGLAIGIPSFIILVGGYLLWMRNRRRDKKEDMQDDLDVELRDNNSFKEFQEALHRPYQNNGPSERPYLDKRQFNSEKQISSAEVGSLSRELGLSTSEPQKTQLVTPAPSVINQHQKTPLSYDFYDTFIPILPDHGNGNGSGQAINAHDLAQPPTIAGDKNSVHSSSNTSLIGSNPDSLSRSLDNLAKQLHSPQFFEKLPLRSATMHMKQRPGSHVLAHNLSSDLIHNTLFDRVAINDDYVYDTASPTSKQKHPYHQRVAQKESLDNEAGDTTVDSTLNTTNLECNFDNNIVNGADFDKETPDVVFK